MRTVFQIDFAATLDVMGRERIPYSSVGSVIPEMIQYSKESGSEGIAKDLEFKSLENQF